MGWLRVFWRILKDKVKAGYLDLTFELTWTALSIATVLLLWNSIVTRVPTGWNTKMVLGFALFLELYYIVRSYIRDVAWAIVEFYLGGRIEPFLKPHPYLYEILARNDGGYILASLIKLPVLVGAILLLLPEWWKGFLAFLLGMIFYGGFEMFVVGASLLFIESGGLWHLLYSFLGYLVEIPADFYKGVARFFVTVLTPVFFTATFPTKAAVGIIEGFPLLVILSVLWFFFGWRVMKLAIKKAQAYGG